MEEDMKRIEVWRSEKDLDVQNWKEEVGMMPWRKI